MKEQPLLLLITTVILLAAPAVSQLSPADGPWSGSIQCQLDVQQPGYSRHEVQTWTLAGNMPTGKNGDMQIYPATWTATGQGGLQRTVGPRLSMAQWNLSVPPAKATIAMFVRASDRHFIIRIWQRPVLTPSSLRGTRQMAENGVVQTPAAFTYGAREWTLPWIEATPEANISGSFGVPSESLGAELTPVGAPPAAACVWNFSRLGAASSTAIAGASGNAAMAGSAGAGAAASAGAASPASAGAGAAAGSSAAAVGAGGVAGAASGAAAGGGATGVGGGSASSSGGAAGGGAGGGAAAERGATVSSGGSARSSAETSSGAAASGAAAGTAANGGAADGAAPLMADSQPSNSGAVVTDVSNSYASMETIIQEQYAKLIRDAQNKASAPGLTAEQRAEFQKQIDQLQQSKLDALNQLHPQQQAGKKLGTLPSATNPLLSPSPQKSGSPASGSNPPSDPSNTVPPNAADAAAGPSDIAPPNTADAPPADPSGTVPPNAADGTPGPNGSAGAGGSSSTPQTSPNSFSFSDKRLAFPLTNYESNTVVISGINVGVPILIVSGSAAYSINGSPYSYAPGTVHAGDRVTLRDQLNLFESSRTSAVKVGDYSASWTITSLP